MELIILYLSELYRIFKTCSSNFSINFASTILSILQSDLNKTYLELKKQYVDVCHHILTLQNLKHDMKGDYSHRQALPTIIVPSNNIPSYTKQFLLYFKCEVKIIYSAGTHCRFDLLQRRWSCWLSTSVATVRLFDLSKNYPPRTKMYKDFLLTEKWTRQKVRPSGVFRHCATCFRKNFIARKFFDVFVSDFFCEFFDNFS